jgi:hypothetical protein
MGVLVYLSREDHPMTRVILDNAALEKLHQAGTSVEICDEAGYLHGYFSPAVDPGAYANIPLPISEEEIRRRLQEKGGRPLAEIMADLERTS